jgi:short-subunit dehydrogenase
MKETALIVGAGLGLSSSLTTLLIRNDFRVALAARNIDKLSTLEETPNVDVYPCDASSIDQVRSLFQKLDKTLGTPDPLYTIPQHEFAEELLKLIPKILKKQ